MASDSSIKRLLVSLKLTTTDFEKEIRKIQNTLKEMNAQSVREHQARVTRAQKENELRLEALATEKRLQAEARTMVAVDQAKAAWLTKQKAELAVKVQQEILNTAEKKKQGVEELNLYRTQQQQLAIKKQELALEQQKARALEQQARAAEMAPHPTAVAKIKQDIGYTAFTQPTAPVTTTTAGAALAQVTEERQRLAVMEAQLKVLASQEGVRKADIAEVEKALAGERARLVVMEQQAKAAATTVSQESVARIKKDIGYTPYVAPQVGGLFGVSTGQAVKQIVEEKQRLTLMEAQLRVMAQQEGVRKVDIAAVQKEIAGERQRLVLLEQQTVQQQRQSLMGRAQAGMAGVTRGIFGGGMMGTMATGMFAGFIGAEVFTTVIGKVQQLGHELSESTGKAVQLREQFEKLSAARGVDPEVFAAKMTAAVRGLVHDEDMFRVANNYMQQGVRATSDEIARLTQLTVALSRSQGKDAAQAMHALTRASLTGRTMVLAMATGIDRQSLAMKGLSGSIDPVTRKTLEFHKVLVEMEKRYAKIGEPALTFVELQKQVSVAFDEFIQAIAVGIAGTQDYKTAMEVLSKKLLEFRPQLEKFGETIGKDIVKAVRLLVENWDKIKLGLEAVIALKVGQWAISLAGSVIGLGKSYATLALRIWSAVAAQTALNTATAASSGVGLAGGAGGLLARGAAAVGVPGLIVGGTVGMAAGSAAVAAKAQGLTWDQAKEGLTEYKDQVLSVSKLVTDSIRAVLDAISTRLATIGKNIVEVIGPVWKDVLYSTPVAALALLYDAVKEYAPKIKELLASATRLLPFGETIHQLKELANLREGRKKLETIPTPGLTGPALIEYTRAEEARKKGETLPEAVDQGPTPQMLKALAELRFKIAEQELKREFELRQMYIDNENDAVKDQYEEGLISLRQYVNAQQDILGTQHQNKIDQILAEAELKKRKLREEEEAQVATLRKQQKEPGIDAAALESIDKAIEETQNPEKRALQFRLIEQETKTALEQEDIKFYKKRGDTERKLFLDSITARREYTTAANKIEEEGVNTRLATIEKEFSRGTMSTESFIQQKKVLLTEERNITQDNAQQIYDASEKNEKALATLRISQYEAQVKYEKQITELVRSEGELRLKELETRYDLAKQLLESQISLDRTRAAGGLGGTLNTTNIETLKKITDEHIKELVDAQTQLGPLTSQNSEEWMKIAIQINKGREELVKMNQELYKARDLAGPLGELFGTISREFGDLLPKQWTDTFSKLSNVMSSLSKLGEQMAASGVKSPMGALGSSFINLFRAVPRSPQEEAKTATQIFTRGLQDGTSALQSTFIPAIRAAAQHLRDLAAGAVSEEAPTTALGFGGGLNLAPSFAPTTAGGRTSTFQNIMSGIFGMPPTPRGMLGGLFGGAPAAATTPAIGPQPFISPFIGGLTTAADVLTRKFVPAFDSAASHIVEIARGIVIPVQDTSPLGVASAPPITTMLGFGGGMNVGSPGRGVPTMFGSIMSSMFGQATGGGLLSKLISPFGGGTAPDISGLGVVGSERNSALASLAEAASGAGEKLGALSKIPFAEKMQGFVGTLTSIMGVVGGTVSTIAGSKTTGTGIFGGIMSGGMTGMQLGGPIGAAIGAGIGGIMGGIVGHKQEIMQQQVDRIKAQLQSIIDQLSSGTISIGNAIGQLRDERQQAIQMLSGNKKAGKTKYGNQYQAVLGALDAEISKLLDMQKQLIDSLHESLMVLSAPTAFQPIIQQLDQIIRKYKEFASAADGNLKEVANANLWLKLSLEQYAQTLSKDLNAAEQTAIENAVKLIDLQKQRYDLVKAEAQQEYDLLTQGVLVRQRSSAATKGAQIAQMRYERDQQLIQIDEQIALADYKYENEKKIFNLASTRLELEKQLLDLQKTAFDLQEQNTIALMQTLAGVQTAIQTGNLPQAIQPGGVLSTGSQLLDQIIQLLGLPSTGITPTATEVTLDEYIKKYFPSEFFELLRKANQWVPGYISSVVPALESPKGSQQRKAAEKYYRDTSGLEVSGKAGGLPVRDWILYIRSGSLPANTPQPPAFEKGGGISQTGHIFAHEGEYVLPRPIVQAIKSGTPPPQVKGGPVLPPSPVGGMHPISPSWLAKELTAPLVGGIPSRLTDLNLKGHQEIYDIASARTSMEMQVIVARRSQLQMEMAHMAAMQDMIGQMRSVGNYGGVVSLEGALAKVYELRGRYGSASFRREVL